MTSRDSADMSDLIYYTLRKNHVNFLFFKFNKNMLKKCYKNMKAILPFNYVFVTFLVQKRYFFAQLYAARIASM